MQMVAEILQHLVQRPEDYSENIESLVKLYKETVLHALEVRTRYIAENGNINICVLSLVKQLLHLFTSVYHLPDSSPLEFGRMPLE